MAKQGSLKAAFIELALADTSLPFKAVAQVCGYSPSAVAKIDRNAITWPELAEHPQVRALKSRIKPRPSQKRSTASRELNDRQRAFVEFKLGHPDATLAECVKAAGYDCATDATASTFGSKLMAKDHVRAALRIERDLTADKYRVTRETLIASLVDLLEGCTVSGDLLTVDEDTGEMFLDGRKLTDAHRRALASIDIEQAVRGRGDDAKPVTKIKLRSHDVLRIVELLAKLTGSFEPEKVDHQVHGLIGIIQGRTTQVSERPTIEDIRDWPDPYGNAGIVEADYEEVAA